MIVHLSHGSNFFLLSIADILESLLVEEKNVLCAELYPSETNDGKKIKAGDRDITSNQDQVKANIFISFVSNARLLFYHHLEYNIQHTEIKNRVGSRSPVLPQRIAPRCFGPSVNDFPFKKTSRGHWPSEGHFSSVLLWN